MITERLHSARLERERVVKEEQQLEKQTLPDKARQSDRPRSQSVTLPTPVGKGKKPPVVTKSILKKNKASAAKKAVNQARKSSTKSATHPISDTSQSSTSTRLPTVVTGLPEKVDSTPIYLHYRHYCCYRIRGYYKQWHRK